MNFSELKRRAEQLCKLEGWTEVSPAPDWGDLVNIGLHRFSWEAEYITSNYSFSSVANQSDYALPAPDWVRVTDVLLGQKVLWLTDENILRAENPSWLLTPASNPERYYVSTTNTLRLYPSPSSVQTVQVRGIRVDTPLVNETDAPKCPLIFHEAVALLAAWEHGKMYAQGEAMQRIANYRQEAMQLANDCHSYQSELSSTVLRRRVGGGRTPKLGLGWRNRW